MYSYLFNIYIYIKNVYHRGAFIVYQSIRRGTGTSDLNFLLSDNEAVVILSKAHGESKVIFRNNKTN